MSSWPASVPCWRGSGRRRPVRRRAVSSGVKRMAPISIRLEHVSKRFDHSVKGEVYAVRDVNLAVEKGELLTLLGPSGCGKSTTLRMIAGFEEPDEGTIFIEGQDVTRVLPNRRGIGFMFQNYARSEEHTSELQSRQ